MPKYPVKTSASHIPMTATLMTANIARNALVWVRITVIFVSISKYSYLKFSAMILAILSDEKSHLG
jgi:hypothetical protein